MANTCKCYKDLSNIKTKLAFSLTKRQIICFGGAAATGLPFYYFMKPVIGIEAASLLMVGTMLPFFLCWNVRKRWLPGGETSLSCDSTKDTLSGN